MQHKSRAVQKKAEPTLTVPENLLRPSRLGAERCGGVFVLATVDKLPLLSFSMRHNCTYTYDTICIGLCVPELPHLIG